MDFSVCHPHMVGFGPTYFAGGTTTARCSLAMLRAPVNITPATALYSLAVLPGVPPSLTRTAAPDEKERDDGAPRKAHSDCASEHVR